MLARTPLDKEYACHECRFDKTTHTSSMERCMRRQFRTNPSISSSMDVY